jgi:uncharacterized membrane protein YuzA (DUF378 family)
MTVSPAEFVLFTSLALVALGPYVNVETTFKKTGNALTIIGALGTLAIGFVIFSDLLPTIFGKFTMPAIIAFPVISIIFAALVGFAVLRARHSGVVASVRNVLLLCAGIWFVTHVVSGLFGIGQPPAPVPVPSADTGPTPYRLGDQFASHLKIDFLSLSDRAR